MTFNMCLTVRQINIPITSHNFGLVLSVFLCEHPTHMLPLRREVKEKPIQNANMSKSLMKNIHLKVNITYHRKHVQQQNANYYGKEPIIGYHVLQYQIICNKYFQQYTTTYPRRAPSTKQNLPQKKTFIDVKYQDQFLVELNSF